MPGRQVSPPLQCNASRVNQQSACITRAMRPGPRAVFQFFFTRAKHRPGRTRRRSCRGLAPALGSTCRTYPTTRTYNRTSDPRRRRRPVRPSAASARNKPLPVLYGGDAATRNTTITPPPPPMQASEAHQGIRSPNLRANRANAPAGGASPAANQPANQRRGGWGGVVAAALPPHACARGAGGGGPG